MHVIEFKYPYSQTNLTLILVMLRGYQEQINHNYKKHIIYFYPSDYFWGQSFRKKIKLMVS